MLSIKSITNNPELFCSTAKKYLEEYPRAKKHLAPVISELSGWGGPEKFSAYGLTFCGIKRIVAQLQINAAVCPSSEELNRSIRSQREGICLYISSSSAIFDFINHCETSNFFNNHAVALAVEKISYLSFALTRIYVFDSEGCENSSYANMNSRLFDMQVFLSLQRRQRKFPTCYTYAIEDCKAILKNPKLLEQIRLEAKVKKGNIFSVNNLPDPMNHLAKRINSLAVTYQMEAIVLSDEEETQAIKPDAISLPRTWYDCASILCQQFQLLILKKLV